MSTSLDGTLAPGRGSCAELTSRERVACLTDDSGVLVSRQHPLVPLSVGTRDHAASGLTACRHPVTNPQPARTLPRTPRA